MKTLALAFYLPQFHPIPENDAWWGPGFTEWTNVTRARPTFPGHYQPHLPRDLGFYDLRLPETRMAQAELAAAHGIDAFVYYHYWFNGRRVLERPFQEVLDSGQPSLPFCLAWANENWTRVWDGSNNKMLLRQEYSSEDDRAHIRSLIPSFADPRYLKIEGRPVFLVYRASLLPDSHRTTDIWREEVVRAGLAEPYLLRVESFQGETGDPRPLGFDAALEFAPSWWRLPERNFFVRAAGKASGHRGPFRHTVRPYRQFVDEALSSREPEYGRWPCVTPMWDNSSRRRRGGLVLSGSTPDLYGRWLQHAVERSHSLAERQKSDVALVFVNAWNEWAEGNHLEPDQKHGLAYLQEHQRVMRTVHGPAASTTS